MKILLVQPNDPVLVTCQDPESKVPRTISLIFLYEPSSTVQKTEPNGQSSFHRVERVFGLKVKEIVQEAKDNEPLTCNFVPEQKGNT